MDAVPVPVPGLQYRTLEPIAVPAPVSRLDAIAAACAGKRVLDLGCLDETALVKRDTEHWLHGRIGLTASRVIGIDNSDALPDEGLATGPNSRIFKGNGIDPQLPAGETDGIDVIVAGEFIEHLPSPLEFLRNVRQRHAGKQLILSTPNGASFANALLGTFGREAQHHDHLMTSTYKTLNTLCQRAGFTAWRIVPYRFYATEMALQSGPAMRVLLRMVEVVVRLVERVSPLRSFGYLVFVTV